MTEPSTGPDQAETVEQLAAAMHQASGSPATWERTAEWARQTWRWYADSAITALTEAGAAMPEEAGRLRADLKRARARERMASQHAHRCDADVAESDATVKRLEAELAHHNAVQARSTADVYIERDLLREVVDGVRTLCDEIRPDSVLGVNPGARLTLIRQVVAATGKLGEPLRREIADELRDSMIVPGSGVGIQPWAPARGTAETTGAISGPDAYPSEGVAVVEAPGATEGDVADSNTAESHVDDGRLAQILVSGQRVEQVAGDEQRTEPRPERASGGARKPGGPVLSLRPVALEPGEKIIMPGGETWPVIPREVDDAITVKEDDRAQS